MSGRSPFLFTLDLCPAPEKNVDVRITLHNLRSLNTMYPQGEMIGVTQPILKQEFDYNYLFSF